MDKLPAFFCAFHSRRACFTTKHYTYSGINESWKWEIPLLPSNVSLKPSQWDRATVTLLLMNTTEPPRGGEQANS